jgi:hypothetical protein
MISDLDLLIICGDFQVIESHSVWDVLPLKTDL